MFTGIITDIGTIKRIHHDSVLRIDVETNYIIKEIEEGASIAHSGVCLTVTKKGNGYFSVDVSEETLSKTNIEAWKEGTRVNLERALKVGDELGGHIVLGHVDGIAEVIDISCKTRKIVFKVPDEFKNYIAEKGSATLDGVSLTTNEVTDNRFSVSIIPHTWENTNFADLAVGSKVNLEIDALARYVARMNEM